MDDTHSTYKKKSGVRKEPSEGTFFTPEIPIRKLLRSLNSRNHVNEQL